MTSPGGRSVRVWREKTDRYGDPEAVDERWLHGVAVAPRTSAESGADRRVATVSTGLTLYVPDPDGAELGAQHRVEVDGVEYRVSGGPAVWSNPLTAWSPGVQVDVDVVEG